MTYEEVVNIIDNKHRFGKACGRDVTEEMLKVLGHPDKGMHIIHIAGTNGKGSVAAFVSSILQAASFASNEKFKVGLFTSPHLIEYTERIQIDGKQISKDDVTRLGEKLLSLKLDLEPTMFDYWLAMALLYYKEQGVKYIVLETGLGGSKDSTNGLSQVPDVCAITSIGLEHTQYLGDTIEKIAAEKAGIIKENGKVVLGIMPDAAKDVIINKAKAMNASYILAQTLPKDVELGLFGKYQRNNGAVAVEVIKLLSEKIDDNIICEGMKKAVWPGRMQIISREPFTIIDGAHNPSGVNALKESLINEFGSKKFSFIMAVMADKDYFEMARIIAPLANRIYTVTVDYSRSLQAKELAEAIKNVGVDALACSSYDEAYKMAADEADGIVVFGSLYFIGEILSKL